MTATKKSYTCRSGEYKIKFSFRKSKPQNKSIDLFVKGGKKEFSYPPLSNGKCYFSL